MSQAIVTLGLRYVAGGNQTINIPTVTSAAIQYGAEQVGIIDVPADTTDDTEFQVPFGSIAKGTLLVVNNKAGVDLDVVINGSDPLFTLPNGMPMVLPAVSISAGHDLAAVSLTTRAASTAAGTIEVYVYGDAP